MVGGRRKGGGREGEGGRKGRREGGCRDAYVQRSGRAVRLPRHEHDGVVEALQAEALLLVGGGVLRCSEQRQRRGQKIVVVEKGQ